MRVETVVDDTSGFNGGHPDVGSRGNPLPFVHDLSTSNTTFHIVVSYQYTPVNPFAFHQ